MSCLFKKGISLIDDDINSKFTEKNSSAKNKLIPKRKFILKNKAKNYQLREKDAKNLFIKRKFGPNIFEVYKKRKLTDQTSKHLKCLQRVDSSLKKDINIVKVRELHMKKLNRSASGLDHKKKKSRQPLQTAFTEEDFEKMNNKWLSLM